jgi:hypothetical protein
VASAVSRVVAIFAVAVVVNFAWEMTQSVLFAPMGGWVFGTWRCFVASLGDGLIVLTITGAGWLIFRRGDWFVRPGLGGYTLMATLGMAIAVLVEHWALATGRWAYTGRMLVIPVVHVGLGPVLQMGIVPPLALWVTVRWLEGRYGETLSR